jgi:hypothetical protein
VSLHGTSSGVQSDESPSAIRSVGFASRLRSRDGARISPVARITASCASRPHSGLLARCRGRRGTRARVYAAYLHRISGWRIARGKRLLDRPDSDTEKSPRPDSEVIDMAESTIDHSIVKRIGGLVHEEQDLYGKGELADHDQVTAGGHQDRGRSVLGSAAPAGSAARVQPGSE